MYGCSHLFYVDFAFLILSMLQTLVTLTYFFLKQNCFVVVFPRNNKSPYEIRVTQSHTIIILTQ